MESESDQSETPELLKLSDKITVLPIVYGSGEFSKIVIEWLLTHQHDCLAVPLPPSFQEPVESAVLELPTLSVVLQHQTSLNWEQGEKSLDAWDDPLSGKPRQANTETASYVPIDPCQGVISAIRLCMGEHIARRFIDLET